MAERDARTEKLERARDELATLQAEWGTLEADQQLRHDLAALIDHVKTGITKNLEAEQHIHNLGELARKREAAATEATRSAEQAQRRAERDAQRDSRGWVHLPSGPVRQT